MSALPIFQLDPASYRSHPLHRQDRDWPETNCYVDVWIELLHALELEVHACLAFTLGVDFEGDQWTFYKPPHKELAELYGLDVQELTLWRPLPEHCVEQLARGSVPLVEMDSFHLPDTAGTDYQQQHVKTTIGVVRIDVERERLGYFHNTGYHELCGRDYRGVFRLEPPPSAASLPPYCEIVKTGRLVVRSENELRERSRALAREQLARGPDRNPFCSYAERFARDVEQWVAGDPQSYHVYSFASIRQFGSAFELASHYTQWLGGCRRGTGAEAPWLSVAAEFQTISSIAKTLILKLARIAHSGRMRDLSPQLGALCEAWERGSEGLRRELSGAR